jgi:O-antigen ligase
MFRHPAITGKFVWSHSTHRPRLPYSGANQSGSNSVLHVFALGITALGLTFSRAGAIGLTVGILVFFAVGGWSGLISRRALIPGIVALAMAGAVSKPLLLVYFGTRPGSSLMRFYLFEAALQGYWQHPILGVGLNNGKAAMKAGRRCRERSPQIASIWSS